ncbi:MAG: MMPL family transporter, partial [Rhodomicrobium sp.]
MLKRLLVGIVGFSARARWLVVAIAVGVAAYSAFFVRQNFAIDTNINNLISHNLPWRQHQAAYLKAFPGQETSILAVIDAPTPELAQSAAARLSKALLLRRDEIRNAQDVRGSAFFRRNGLLYLSDEELSSILRQLARSGPLLGSLVSDPSLRGIMSSIDLSLRGVRFRRISLDTLAPQFRGLTDAIDNTLSGKPAYFSWTAQLQAAGPKPQTRQFVTISPVLDFNALEPGREATDAIRQTVDDLKLLQQGVTVRLTGPVPISDDEFETLRQGAAENMIFTIAAVILILWLALHSARIIIAVMFSVVVGLAATAAAGLSLVGALNPISIAFFVLFVGIGVDFGLQFSVSYRAARYEHHGLMCSLLETAATNGGRLVLAALATAAGFLSFLPTAYKGVSELGEIAGVGMIIALITSLTVLPALLRVLDPPAEPRPLGYAFLCPLDRFLERHRVVIVAGTVAAVFAALPLLSWLQFDFNPMDLRNPKVESVATYLDISKDPETSGRTAEILAPSLDQASSMAKTLQKLPEVARAITLSSFIPEAQDQKLAAIKEKADGLHDYLYPAQVKPPPGDAEIVSSLEATATSLGAIAGERQGPGAQAAKDLSEALSRLA